MNLETQPNERRADTRQQWHVVALPQCCPVSGNPQPGSMLTIGYTPADRFIEVYSLHKYIASYIGGRGDVRSMEGMIQQIAADCATAVGVRVTVTAFVRLQANETAVHIAEAG